MKNTETQQEDVVFVPERFERERDHSLIFKALLFLVPVILGFVLLLLAKTVTVTTMPVGAHIQHTGGVSLFVGNKLYGFGSLHTLVVSAPGYASSTVDINLDEDPAALQISLEELLGEVSFLLTGPEKGSLYINEALIGEVGVAPVKLPRGSYRYRIEHPRYLPASGSLDVKGLGQAQSLSAILEPNWRSVSLSSLPDMASVLLDGKLLGQTPLTVDLVPDLYVLTYRKDGYEDKKQLLEIELGPEMAADTVALTLAGGEIQVKSFPIGARVMIDGVYAGLSPLRQAVEAGKRHEVIVEKEGYDRWQGTIVARTGHTAVVDAALTQQFGDLALSSIPASDIFVNGKKQGKGTVTVRLPVGNHEVEFRRAGYRYVKQLVQINKEVRRDISIKLLTEKEARHAEARPVYTNPAGTQMVLVKPWSYTMGAPRGEPGQMANEALRQVRLERWFYIAESEVSERQFALFLKENKETLKGFTHKASATSAFPVTGVQWSIAALYCNWLSRREGLPEAYRMRGSRLVLDPASIGYRLPTEAEWEWSARVAGRQDMPLLKYPWGNGSIIPKGTGNFSDRDAPSTVPHRIADYADGFAKTAPVKSFTPNPLGIYDLGGNVAEWVHDYYGVYAPLSGQVFVDPTGPVTGLDHVVKGSSWKSGNETELRFSYRTFGEGASDHIGFRTGRWVH